MLATANGRTAPGPRFRTPLGFMATARKDLLGFLLVNAQQYGDVVRYQFGPGRFCAHHLVHPDHIKYVLQEHNQNYWKGVPVSMVKVLIGQGLFTSEGDFWRRQRRLAQPAFHRERIAGFVRIMTDGTAKLIERWQPQQQSGDPIDVADEMMRVTLGIVGQALFSQDLAGDATDVGRAMYVALEHVTHRATHFVPLPLAIPTARNLRFLKARRVLDALVYRVISERRRAGMRAAAVDLLDMFLQARDADTGEGMSDQQLRDEVMTFVLAGHETTAVTLAWAWYLLSQHSTVEDRLRAEVRDVLGTRTPTMDDVPRLPYARAVIEETMRLYPAVSMISRQSYGEDEIGGYHIPANTVIMMSPYVTHRNPTWWERPDEFDPERFMPGRENGRPRFAYFPFSGGPRLCIGNEFALTEAQLILAMVLQRYRLQLVPGHPVEPEVRLTLRPRYGIKMTVQAS